MVGIPIVDIKKTTPQNCPAVSHSSNTLFDQRIYFRCKAQAKHLEAFNLGV